MTKKFIYITTTTEFIHCYPNAPAEVGYLRHYHRHLAHIKVRLEVFHTDREIEFILFKHEVEDYLKRYSLCEYNEMSCENIAEKLIADIRYNYGRERDIWVEVSEDGENGCILECKAEDE